MPEKIRSQSPDITVAVGNGKSLVEFECYKFVLAFASPYFDAMLSTDMAENNSSRIEFPNKDPEEWKLFYMFIDPSYIGVANHSGSTLCDDTARKLAPWFHEFQMDSYLEKCDEILSKEVVLISKKGRKMNFRHSFWDKDSDGILRPSLSSQRRSAFGSIMELMQLACLYDLHNTRAECESAIQFFLVKMLPEMLDLFSQDNVRSLVQLSLPLEEVGGQENGKHQHFASRGISKVLWDFLAGKDFEQRLAPRYLT